MPPVDCNFTHLTKQMASELLYNYQIRERMTASLGTVCPHQGAYVLIDITHNNPKMAVEMAAIFHFSLLALAVFYVMAIQTTTV